MADTASPNRIEPTLGSASPTPTSARAVDELRAAIEAPPVAPAPMAASAVTAAPAPVASGADTAPSSARGALDQLSRIEDKAARIEEKYARTETLLQRVQDKVETATGRMGEVASQADLVAVRTQIGTLSDRVRRVPGFGSLIVTAVVTALLTSAITVALLKYVPGLLVR